MKIIILLLFSLLSNTVQQSTSSQPISFSSSVSFDYAKEQKESNLPLSKRTKKKRLKKKKLKKRQREKGIKQTKSKRSAKAFLILGIITLTLALAGVVIGIIFNLSAAIFLIAVLFGLFGTYCLVAGLVTAKKAGGLEKEKNSKPVQRPSIRHIGDY